MLCHEKSIVEFRRKRRSLQLLNDKRYLEVSIAIYDIMGFGQTLISTLIGHLFCDYIKFDRVLLNVDTMRTTQIYTYRELSNYLYILAFFSSRLISRE